MSYFNNFPTITYNFDIGGQTTLLIVKDIALNVRVRKEIFENVTLYDEYDIEDHETFDIISEKLYGKPIYHWTIMLLNLRFDHRKDFPMTSQELLRYCEQKYGKDHIYDQHQIFGNLHFEDRDGNIVTKLTETQFNALYPFGQYQEYQQSLIDAAQSSYPILLTESQYNEIYPVYGLGTMFSVPQSSYEEYLYNRQQIIDSINQQALLQGLSEDRFNTLYPFGNYAEYSLRFESISNYEYEDRINESKRRIKVLNAQAIDKVVDDVRRLLSGT